MYGSERIAKALWRSLWITMLCYCYFVEEVFGILFAWEVNHNFLLKEKQVVWGKVHLRLVVEVLAIQGGIASVLKGPFEVGGGSSLDCCCWFQIACVRSCPFPLKEEQKGWDYERKSFGTRCEVSVLCLHSLK
jgi:hypothetical protein